MVRKKLTCPLEAAETLNPVHFAAQILRFRTRSKVVDGSPTELTDVEVDQNIAWEEYVAEDGTILAADIPEARVQGVRHQPSLAISQEIRQKLQRAAYDLRLVLAIHPEVRLILEESKIPIIGCWSKLWAGTSDCYRLGKWVMKFGLHTCFGVTGGLLQVGTQKNGNQWLWLVILDIDERDPVRQQEILEKLGKKTLLVKTPGGGLHAYFLSKRKVTNRGSRVYHRNCDIRGKGGQVMAPGAVNIEGKVYSYAQDNPFFFEKPSFIPDGWQKLLRECDEEQEARYGSEIFKKIRIVLDARSEEDREFEAKYPRKRSDERAGQEEKTPEERRERDSSLHPGIPPTVQAPIRVGGKKTQNALGKSVSILEIPVPVLLRVFETKPDYRVPESVRWQTAQRIVGYLRGVGDLPPAQVRERLLLIREKHFENPGTFTVQQVDNLVKWSHRVKSNQERFDGRYTTQDPRSGAVSSFGTSLMTLETQAVGLLVVAPVAMTRLVDIIDAFTGFFQMMGVDKPRKPHPNAFSRMLRSHGFEIWHTRKGNLWNVDFSKLLEAARNPAQYLPTASVEPANGAEGTLVPGEPSPATEEAYEKVSDHGEKVAKTMEALKEARERLLLPVTRSPQQLERDRLWTADLDVVSIEDAERSRLDIERQWAAL